MSKYNKDDSGSTINIKMNNEEVGEVKTDENPGDLLLSATQFLEGEESKYSSKEYSGTWNKPINVLIK